MRKKLDKIEFLKKTGFILFILLVCMTACFFTWSENVVITRIIKVVGRLSVMIGSIVMYRRILRHGAVDNLQMKNPFPFTLYSGYLALGFISFLWSSDAGVSALQWFMITQTFVFSYYFIKSLYLLDIYFPERPIRLYTLLGHGAFLLILVFVIGMWVNPDVFFRMTHGGEEARLGGYMMNPNELGMLAGVGIAGLIFQLKNEKRKWLSVIQLLVLFYALMATGSRSSLIGGLLICGYHIYNSKNTKLKIALFVCAIAVVPIAVNKIILKDGDTSRMEEVMSMTGRLPFWEALISEGLPREPLLGFGFMRIDYREYFQSTHTYPGKMTHNTFMQVLMNLGFVGLITVLFQMIQTIRAIRTEASDKKMMLFSILIPILINSFTEFGIFGEANYGILFFQLIFLYVTFQPGKFISTSDQMKLEISKRNFR